MHKGRVGKETQATQQEDMIVECSECKLRLNTHKTSADRVVQMVLYY